MFTHWHCHICGKRRLDKDISVLSKDANDRFGVALVAVTENVIYCNDDPDCIEKAKTFTFLKR